MNKWVRFAQTLVLAILMLSLADATNVQASWWETMKLKGDFRHRHEMIDVEGKDARHRQRIRARLGVFGDVSEFTKIGIQLATGSDDPVSTNQTLDGAFSTKSIGLDLAYMEARIKGVKGLKITGGKMKNPFYKPGKSELIFDGDLNPEGAAVTLTSKTDNLQLSAVGSGLWIDERSSGDDTYLAAGQAMAKASFNEKKSGITVGGGYYKYGNVMGILPIHDDEDAFGNSTVPFFDGTDTVMVYANEYDLLEVFAEVSHMFENTPVALIGHFVTNSGADSLNTGWSIGVRAGKTKNTGSWAFRYAYKQVESDAVIGAFTDSDFIGGGTNGKGHEVGASVMLAKRTSFDVTYFMNEIGLSSTSPVDFSRLQVDVQMKI